MTLAKAKLDWRAYTTVFAVTAALTTIYHLLDQGVKVALLFDGRHYFESCQHVVALILALLSMKPDAVVAAELALRDYIMLDGPVLPTLFGSMFALLGKVPASSDWTLLVWAQTILHALAVTLICKITFKLTQNKASAFICSALWAIYPAALIATGRLMTESLAVVLLLSLPLALRGAIGTTKKVNSYAVASGIISGLLILLKPGMIPSVGLCWLSALALSRTRLTLLLAMTVGTLLTLSPWILYTKQTTGKAVITVQRMPVHNALIGWDPETSGWQTNPPSGFEQVLNTGGEPLSTICGIWISHPKECAEILLEKFGHLYSTPWNDYRAHTFGLNPHLQGAFHFFLLFAGFAGLFAYVLTADRKNRLAILCLAAASGQCVYLMFEPVCRYAFPQLAFAPVFAALALKLFFKRKKDRKTLAIAALIALVCVDLISQSEAWSSRRLVETKHNFNANETIHCKIVIEKKHLTHADAALLLIDGNMDLENATVEVNGRRCSDKLIPFNYFDPQRYQAFNLLKELGYGLNAKVDDFRMWRAIPISLDSIKDGIANVKILPGEKGSIIYGDKQLSRKYLSPDFLCVNRLINSKSSMEMRNASAVSAGTSNRSWVNDFAQSSSDNVLRGRDDAPQIRYDAPQGRDDVPKVLDDVPRVHVLLAEARNRSQEKQPAQQKQVLEFAKNLLPADFDENLRTGGDEIKISRSILKAARTTGVVIEFPTFEGAQNLDICLEGDMRAQRKPGTVGVVIETVSANQKQTLLARLPSSLSTTEAWTHFRLCDIAPAFTNKSPIKTVSIAFFPGPWQQVAGYGADKKCTDTLIKNLRLSIKESAIPSLENMQLRFF